MKFSFIKDVKSEDKLDGNGRYYPTVDLDGPLTEKEREYIESCYFNNDCITTRHINKTTLERKNNVKVLLDVIDSAFEK